MKYGLKITMSFNAIEAVQGTHQGLVKEKMADLVAKQLKPMLQLTETASYKDRETDFSTEFVFMPGTQWQHVKKMLLAMCIFSDLKTKQDVAQIVGEIENK